MKSISLTLLLIVMMCVCLPGCGSKPAKPESTTDQPAKPTPDPRPPADPPKPIPDPRPPKGNG